MTDAPSLRARLAEDVARAGRLAAGGVALFACVEPIVSIALAQGSVRVPVALRFFALDLTLALVLLGLVAGLLAAVFVTARLATSAIDQERARAWPGLFAPRAADEAADPRATGLVPWMWAGLIAAGVFGGASFALTLRFIKRFKEPTLIAGSLSALHIGLALVAALIAVFLGFGLRAAGRKLAPRLGALNPLARPLPALALLLAAAVPAALIIVKRAPQLKSVAPWRELLAAGVVAIGVGLAARFLAVRRLWPAERTARRKAVGAFAGGAVLLSVLTLGWWGADPETKYLAISASPPLGRLVALVRTANDFDRDGYGSLLGENDCAPFDPKRHPTARDIPDNGIDENCNGRDFSTKNAPAWKSGEKLPVPPDLPRDWNVLLITVDTVRYDHTTMGGYKQKKGRDTTPELAKLAARSVNFEFAQAPSAGTMASIPAIVTSKFFHSGIHLGPERRPMPPKILDGNVLLGEVMKQAGYRTGAILTHEYFNDWGLDQGMDTYDNELGAKSDPYGIKADKTTDKAQAWIAKQGRHKWFLWVHYIDPHGRYVAHPGEVQYGKSEEDLYDGELRWTDKQLGRLFDFVARMPNADKTIIIVTSDHGDGFNEHGFINHGTRLYKELQHVPLVFYVPDNEPTSVEGPVSNLDIFPTVADLIGADVSGLGLEGESLVPQLFYGRDAKDRVVFAETNYPDPLRAAIAHDYKLIYNLKANVYELYDLRADPWEKKNVWGRDTAGSEKMKALLDEWLDRVFYSRDPGAQAQQVRAQALLPARPTPETASDATGAGAVKLLGWGLDKPRHVRGEPVTVTLYFESLAETPTSYRFEVGVAGAPGSQPPVYRLERVPVDGLFPTSRWKPGEFVKVEFPFKAVPLGYSPSGVRLTFRMLDDKRQPVPLVGPGGAALGPELDLGPLPLD